MEFWYFSLLEISMGAIIQIDNVPSQNCHHGRETRTMFSRQITLAVVFVVAFVLMVGCAHQAKPSVTLSSTGLSASRPPTTPGGITLEWQTLRPIYRYQAQDTTSSCLPTWGVIKPIYRIATEPSPPIGLRGTPWGEIKPVYRTGSARTNELKETNKIPGLLHYEITPSAMQ